MAAGYFQKSYYKPITHITYCYLKLERNRTEIVIQIMAFYNLPLFPLNVVVCPKGIMNLRIFEPRYLPFSIKFNMGKSYQQHLMTIKNGFTTKARSAI